MKVERSYASCGLIQNPENGPEVVLAGDYTSEIFNLGTQTWREGPVAPFDHLCNSAQFGDTFLVVGGYDIDFRSDKIFEFDHINYGWIQRSQTLSTPKESTTVITMTKDFVEC